MLNPGLFLLRQRAAEVVATRADLEVAKVLLAQLHLLLVPGHLLLVEHGRQRLRRLRAQQATPSAHPVAPDMPQVTRVPPTSLRPIPIAHRPAPRRIRPPAPLSSARAAAGRPVSLPEALPSQAFTRQTRPPAPPSSPRSRPPRQPAPALPHRQNHQFNTAASASVVCTRSGRPPRQPAPALPHMSTLPRQNRSPHRVCLLKATPYLLHRSPDSLPHVTTSLSDTSSNTLQCIQRQKRFHSNSSKVPPTKAHSQR